MNVRARILTGLILILIVLGIGRVRMGVDVLDLFPDTLPEVQGLKAFLTHFSREDEMIILLEGDDLETLTESQEALAVHLRERTAKLGQVISDGPWSLDSTETVGELVAWLLLNATSPEMLEEGLQGLRPAHRQATLRDSLDVIENSMEFDEALTLAYDPYQLTQPLRREQAALLAGSEDFVSDDGSLRLLIIQAPPGVTANYQSTTRWVDQVKRESLSWHSSTPDSSDLQLGFTGEPVFEAEISSAMQRDMTISGSTALVLTALIFALAYRRLRPLLALIACLTLTFALTLGLAGWMLDSITMMSVGFASILIGLTVDYGVIFYQDTLRHPEGGPGERRRRVGPSIAWAATTTAAAFAALSLSVLPGIATLGQLVAIGILLGAAVMLGFFPLLQGPASGSTHAPVSALPGFPIRPFLQTPVRGVIALFLAFLALTAAWRGFPSLDPTSDALRPRHSGAYEAMDRLETKLAGNTASAMAILSLETGSETPEARLARWESHLQGLSGTHTLPGALIPRPSHLQSQLDRIPFTPEELDDLERAANEAGFEPSALDLTRAIVEHWRRWKTDGIPRLPRSPEAERLWSRLIAMNAAGQPTQLLLTFKPESPAAAAEFWELVDTEADSLPVSWARITHSLNTRVPLDLRQVGIGLLLAVTLMLALTFRRWQEVLATLAVTVLTLLSLVGAMHWLGWDWNFFSLGALLLTFGAGLDYSIHILLDHRRNDGDRAALHRGVLRALRVCALSTIAGFGSIAWASHQGLASLGKICALGMALNALVALVMLPWLLEVQRKEKSLAR